jgi:high-affinity nickel-transport protein
MAPMPAVLLVVPALLAALAPLVGALGAIHAQAVAAELLGTALVLGIRHGIDWDHIAAITDITSTTAAAEHGEQHHALDHLRQGGHIHAHGGPSELAAHEAAAQRPPAPSPAPPSADPKPSLAHEQRRAMLLGTLYALGHAAVVAVLGLAALAFGAVLPDWVDPIMGRVVGITLLVLGAWVFYSLYQYVRHGTEFHLRSRWMLVFAWARYAWRWLMARLHGHAHVEPIEMASYGARTAFGVGMIHGIGAETGTQVLFIGAIGGAAGLGLGVPMMLAFIIGLLISNTAIVIITATGFVASQMRQRIYVGVGVVAGTFSIVVGSLFLFQSEGILPDLTHVFGFIGR